jgi:hypothetical protein
MPRVTGKKGLCGENEIDSSVQDFRRRGMVFMTNISVLEKKTQSVRDFGRRGTVFVTNISILEKKLSGFRF